MKKLIKWVLIITAASMALCFIFVLFESDEDKAIYEVTSKAELLEKAKTSSELDVVYAQLDSIYSATTIEVIKPQIDSLRNQKDVYLKNITANFEKELKYEAYSVAKEYIRQNLKSPSTAKFAPLSETVLFKDDAGIYNLSIEVDAQNSFGAMLRNQYYIAIGVIDGKVVVLGGM